MADQNPTTGIPGLLGTALIEDFRARVEDAMWWLPMTLSLVSGFWLASILYRVMS